jgi:hypothetical protein
VAPPAADELLDSLPLPDFRQPVSVTVCDDSLRLLLLWLDVDGELVDCPVDGVVDWAPTAIAIAAENTVPNMNSRFIQSLLGSVRLFSVSPHAANRRPVPMCVKARSYGV